MKLVNLSEDGRSLLLRIYDADFEAALEFVRTELTGARFDPVRKMWTVPDTHNNEQRLMADKWRFVGEAYCEIATKVELKPRKLLDVPPTYDYTQDGLRSYQNDAVWALKERHDRAVLSMPPGTGKTLMGMTWLRTLKDPRVLIVCPAFLKTHWQRSLMTWIGMHSISVKGRTPYKLPRELKCLVINYDILYDWGRLLKGSFDTIVCDESHYLINEDAKRTQAVRYLADVPNLLFMTGTPIRSKTYQFLPVLRMIHNEPFRHKDYFLHKFCGPHFVRNKGLMFDGISNEEELFHLLKHYMVRKTKEDVLPFLPRKNRVVYEVTADTSEMDALAEGMDDLSQLERERREAAISRTGYFLKRQFIKELVEELYEAVRKVVVVAFHHDVIDDLKASFPDASVIDGRVSPSKRQGLVDAFQKAEEAIIILQTQAGGVGFELDTSHDMVMAELVWVHGDIEQIEDRIHRMNTEADQVNYFYPLVVDTIEEAMYDRIQKNSGNASKVLDGIDKKHFDGATKQRVDP